MNLLNFLVPRLSPCGQLVQQYDRDRYLCALFTDTIRREALFSIYAFYYEISRIKFRVTDPLLGQIRFQWWRESIDKVLEGRIERHEIIIGLDAAIRNYKLHRILFFDLIDIWESGLTGFRFTTIKELIDFCLETDGKLGDIALEILNAKNIETYQAARNISVALGLMTLLRNSNSLVYKKAIMFPVEIWEKHTIIESKFLKNEFHDGLRDAVKDLGLLIKEFLNLARNLTNVEYKIASPILLQGPLIGVYLKELEHADWNIFHESLNSRPRLQAWHLLAASMRRTF